MMTINEMNQIRNELGLSYQRICMESGVPIGTVQKVLGGITKNPRMETMRRLEEALGNMKRVYNAYHKNPSGAGAGMLRDAPAAYAAGYDSEFTGASGSKKCPHPVTAAEREELPDDRRTELIDGILYDMASPSMPHQDICAGIWSQLNECIRKNHSVCHAYMAPADVCLDKDEYTVVQPDVFIVCDRSQITRKNIQGAPAFILEVLSPSTEKKDKEVKLQKYINAGVREYWLIDPDRRKVIVFDMTGGEASVKNHTEETAAKKEAAPKESRNTYDVFIYDFSDLIPLAIAGGKCHIDMKRIREMLDELYS